MGAGPDGPKRPPTADELEQRRRLLLIQQNQGGRSGTLLTSALGRGLGGDTPSGGAGAAQTLLGA